ncbi:hypothetical protein POTOM_052106 [Populus tomentosa]|uniref:Acid phosphatase 1 n=1 Tax=Populus tomentosa TaxID=118781 RepID=A0A8X8CAA5_POPTO|nr:hypothetical protein POTOM_052106 [Populus tomentosa]
MIKEMVHRLREMLLFLFLAIFSKATGVKAYSRGGVIQESAAYCLSWRLAVETNNVRAWRTVPSQCLRYVEAYMLGGQYERDLNLIVDQILSYVNGIVPSSDGMDAWILDVDDTCISNVFYYRGKRYGCDPYDPAGFRAWALKGGCPAIPAILGLFEYLVQSGFKVFLVTGRDQETLGQVTIDNLHNQGFIGYERIILSIDFVVDMLKLMPSQLCIFSDAIRMAYDIPWICNLLVLSISNRTAEFIGQSAVAYKSEIRRQLEKEGYRIWGNVGDQWSDLQGECLGNRTFKLPNPMYFVP